MLERFAAVVVGLTLVVPVAASAPDSRAERLRDWRVTLDHAAGLDDEQASAALYRSILDEAARLGDQGILVARATDALADLHRRKQRFALAVPLYERSTEMWARLLGPEQPRLAVSLHNLGVRYVELARWEAAERALNAAAAIWLRHDDNGFLEHTNRALRAAREHRKIPWTEGGGFTRPR